MSNHIGWDDIAPRLLLTVVAGAAIGLNRGEHGRAAGMRTTVLVCLAASVAMIQVNLPLPLAGKAGDSFIVMDPMRLPLGILSGVGFIGAGTILRRDNLVIGVTTAATLWFVTVVGLCLGAGQLVLGMTTFGIGLVVLLALKPVEMWSKTERQGTLILRVRGGKPAMPELRTLIESAGYRVTLLAVTTEPETSIQDFECLLKWRAREDDLGPPPFLEQLAGIEGAIKVAWQPSIQRI